MGMQVGGQIAILAAAGFTGTGHALSPIRDFSPPSLSRWAWQSPLPLPPGTLPSFTKAQQEVLSQVADGSLRFKLPEEMAEGHPFVVEAAVTTNLPGNLADIFIQAKPTAVRIAPSMALTLEGDAFQIQPSQTPEAAAQL